MDNCLKWLRYVRLYDVQPRSNIAQIGTAKVDLFHHAYELDGQVACGNTCKRLHELVDVQALGSVVVQELEDLDEVLSLHDIGELVFELRWGLPNLIKRDYPVTIGVELMEEAAKAGH